MVVANKFNQYVEYQAEKIIDLGADTLKVLLTNTAPVASNSIKADLVEIAAGNGYTAGGTAASISSSSQTSGIYKLVLADVVFTAAGGSIGPFRYAVLYDDTPAAPADPLILWWDYGSAVTLPTGETFTWDADATTGILTIT